MDIALKLLMFFGCAVALSANAVQSLSLDPVTERRLTIGKTETIHLVKAGKADFEVAIPKNANPRVRAAGRQLCQLLGKITGTTPTPIEKATGIRPAFVDHQVRVEKVSQLELTLCEPQNFSKNLSLFYD